MVFSIVLKSVRYGRHKPGKRYVWNSGKRYRIKANLEPVKVGYIIREKDLGRSVKEIAAEIRQGAI